MSTDPRTWSLPPEPGRDVVAVKDRYGQVFERVEDPDRPRVKWYGTVFREDEDIPDLMLDWVTLLADLGPVTEVYCTCLEDAEDRSCPVHGQDAPEATKL